MNKKKILLVAAVVVALLFVGLIVLANILITPERVRQTVVPLAEEQLDRKVELGEIDISLFSGISIKDMEIAKKEGQGSFVAAEKVVLRYSLLALLTLQVKVDEVTLVKPAIEVIRYKDGSFNFSDLAGGAAPAAETVAAPAQENAGDEAPIDLRISQVTISDGRFLFIDQAAAGGTERHEITKFNFKARDVSTSEPFPVELGADWNGNELGVKGSVDPAGSGVDVEAFFNRVHINVKGNAAGKQPVAELRLPKTSLSDILSSIPRAYVADDLGKGLAGSVGFSVTMAEGAVMLHQLDVVINDQSLRLKAQVADVNKQPFKVNAELTSEQLVIDKLLVDQPGEAQPASTTDTAATTAAEAGPFDIPVDLTTKVKIGKVVYNQIPVSDFGLEATLRNNLLTVETLRGHIAGGSFINNSTVNLGVKGLQYTTALTVSSVQGRDLVQLFKPELADAVQGAVGGTVKLNGKGTLPETIKKRLSGQGRLTLADGRLQSIPALNAVAALLDVRELRTIDLDKGAVDFSIKDGKVSLSSTITGSTTRLSTGGDVGLDGSMNLRSQLALSPELGGRLHTKGKLSRYLGDDGGWTTVPLSVKGSFDNPDVGLDSKGLKKQAEKAVKKEVEKKLEKELKRGLQRLFGN